MERFFNKLKQFRRIATRYEKLSRTFLAFIHIASTAVSLGARLSRHDIDVTIDREHARCSLDGLYLANGRQHIWREPLGLAGIRALLGHPHLDRPKTRAVLGVVERRSARRISSGKFMNFTRAEARFE